MTMNDKIPMPAAGNDGDKGAADGVGAPEQRGRTPEGESGGGAYAQEVGPPEGKGAGAGGFMGHGGQEDIAYHGGGQAGDEGPAAGNGTTGSDDIRGEGKTGPKPGPSAPYQDREVEQTREESLADGRTVELFEESGIAAAEASGNTGVEGQRKLEGEQPGSG
jgi:hypothetical protein